MNTKNNINKMVGYNKLYLYLYIMEEKYLTIIYNIYNFRYILNTGKIFHLPKIRKYKVLIINNK
jgi:hypothetical protein